MIKIIGSPLPNIPWQDKPEGCRDAVWRHDNNPLTGFVQNVVFPCATLQDAATGRIVIYYGAADTFVAAAYTTVDELIPYLKANSALAQGDDIEFR